MAPPKEDSKLILHETDEADNQTAIFIYSEPSDQSKQSPARVDISVRQSQPSSASISEVQQISFSDEKPNKRVAKAVDSDIPAFDTRVCRVHPDSSNWSTFVLDPRSIRTPGLVMKLSSIWGSGKALLICYCCQSNGHLMHLDSRAHERNEGNADLSSPLSNRLLHGRRMVSFLYSVMFFFLLGFRTVWLPIMFRELCFYHQCLSSLSFSANNLIRYQVFVRIQTNHGVKHLSILNNPANQQKYRIGFPSSFLQLNSRSSLIKSSSTRSAFS